MSDDKRSKLLKGPALSNPVLSESQAKEFWKKQLDIAAKEQGRRKQKTGRGAA